MQVVRSRADRSTVDPQHRLTLTDADSALGGDSLLTGLAAAAGSAAIAVVLTGMLHDGTQGARDQAQ